MLRIILLSLVWAICATCLVRPWFWKFVKNLFNDGVRIEFTRELKENRALQRKLKENIQTEIGCFIIVFLVSMFFYAMLGVRTNLYGSFLMIMLCFLAQSIWENQKICDRIFLSIVVISVILWIQDGIVSMIISAPINKVRSVPLTTIQKDEETGVKLFVSSSEIKSLFKVDSALGPTYNNGKYIFTVSGGDNGKGIVIIDKDNCKEANFLSCSYELDITDVRSQYPTKKLKELYITISDDNEPYGLFAVADKSWILGSYKVNGYVMFNLITGETQEFKQEELPEFVLNN